MFHPNEKYNVTERDSAPARFGTALAPKIKKNGSGFKDAFKKWPPVLLNVMISSNTCLKIKKQAQESTPKNVFIEIYMSGFEPGIIGPILQFKLGL